MGTFALISIISQVASALWPVVQPTAAVVIPGALTYLAHRFIKNQETADTLSSAAGVAYNHMGVLFAANGSLDMQAVRSEAVSVAVNALGAVAQKKLGVLTDPAALKNMVDGALGRLLAADPSFHVTQPVMATLSSVAHVAQDIVPSAAAVASLQQHIQDSIKAAVGDAVTKGVAAAGPLAGLLSHL